MFTLPQLTAKGRAVDTLSHGEGYSSTEDSAISSDHHLSRHPSTDSLDRFTMADQSKTSGIYLATQSISNDYWYKPVVDEAFIA